MTVYNSLLLQVLVVSDEFPSHCGAEGGI